ncbi:MAG: helix-turn-helix domain-containing protein [Pirellulaceae bacterium]|nr:helix-turn-helix domain-containing protein [Pirellulaceae bacterium]
MSSNFIPLEEAAKKLGVTTDELVEMRSRGDIFGYRDGASWKFKPEELDRVRSELQGDALDEDPAGSSILVSEHDVGPAGSKLGSTIGSDIQLATDDGADIDSDVSLVPDPGGGSDVKLVAGRAASSASNDLDLDDDELVVSGGSNILGGGSDIKPGSSNRLSESDLRLSSDDDDDDELSLQSDDDLGVSPGSGLGSGIVPGSGLGSDIEIGSDIAIEGGSDLMAGLSPVTRPSRGGSGKDLSLNDDDDLVLGGGSDLALGNDSGINLMSPSDSGISLEDEPLDLAGSGISGLDLAAEGSDASASGLAGASGAGSGVEFPQGEEFQLSPSGSMDTDDDSGSQVIELEDSSEFGDAAVALPADDGGFGAEGFGADDGFGGAALGAAAGASGGAVVMSTPDVPFQTGMVLVLLGILMIMGMSGILVSDLVRNMWQYADGSSDLSSGFTKAIVSIMGGK